MYNTMSIKLFRISVHTLLLFPSNLITIADVYSLLLKEKYCTHTKMPRNTQRKITSYNKLSASITVCL